MSSLALKKRRSLAVLQSLSQNMTKSSECMTLKEAADVLYACSTLNFVDEVSLLIIVLKILMLYSLRMIRRVEDLEILTMVYRSIFVLYLMFFENV